MTQGVQAKRSLEQPDTGTFAEKRSDVQRFGVLRSFSRLEWFSLTVVVAIMFLAAFGSQIAPFDPEQPNSAQRLQPPSSEHWLGTDENGMDVFSRILSAPRTDVLIAVTAAGLAVILGAPAGVLVGFFEGGKRRISGTMSSALLRLLDVVQAFPVFVLALVLVAIRGPSQFNIIAALVFVNTPVFIRLTRAELLSLRERPYAEAARAAGGSDLRIAFRHLLPNAIGPVIWLFSVTIGFAILLTAGLSFVGAGIAPPTPELGAMISSSASYMVLGQWWPSFFPGLALGLTVFCFATLGVALGRALEPSGQFRPLGDRPGNHPGVTLGRPTEQTPIVRAVSETAAQSAHVGNIPVESPAEQTDTSVVLRVSDLSIEARGGEVPTQVLDGISFSLRSGEILGIVGESGSGKSVLVRSLLRLLPENLEMASASIEFEGRELTELSENEMRKLRGSKIAHVLPDAKSQLNPVLRIGTLMTAVIRVHKRVNNQGARKRASAALDAVGIPDPDRRLSAYPHELSGGMAQRVCVALALIHEPDLIIADEPTFGLDVTVQRQVLDLMAELAHNKGAALIIVTRDLGIAAQYCHNVAVMRGGRIIEHATVRDLFGAPKHEYTASLIASATGTGHGAKAMKIADE